MRPKNTVLKEKECSYIVTVIGISSYLWLVAWKMEHSKKGPFLIGDLKWKEIITNIKAVH